MSNFKSFLSYIAREFEAVGVHSIDIQHDALGHLANLKSDSTALFIQQQDRALLFYTRDDECVILGSILDDSSRKFKQLLILSIDTKGEFILDNTGNKIDKHAIKESLKDWLIKNIA